MSALPTHGDIIRAKPNLAAIESALKAEEPGGDLRRVARAEPFFQTCKTGLPTEYSQIEETVAPEALNRISD